MTLRLSDFDAITFDVYGTLIDWEPSIADFLRRWAASHGIGADAETLVMAFDGARARIQKERPAHLYPDVLNKCFDAICADFGVPVDPDLRRQFSASPHTWPAFADSHDGLVRLQQSARIGALSNIDVASLNTSCRILDFRFDVVVTAQRVGAYKPDWPHFDTGIGELARLGCRANASCTSVRACARISHRPTSSGCAAPGSTGRAACSACPAKVPRKRAPTSRCRALPNSSRY